MVTTTRPDTFWMNPAPLWTGGLQGHATAGQAQSQPPMILRFVTDSFMDEFNDLLAAAPARLAEYRARPETWRGFTRPELPEKDSGPMASPLRRFGLELPVKKTAKSAVVPAAASTEPLKLYQPAQQRFYLVTSSLICDVALLPDRHVNPGQQERVGFVVRRLWPATKTKPEADLGFPNSTWKEYAFVPQANGTFAWSVVADKDRMRLQKSEELLPMFPVSYALECPIHGRRVWAGLIPVGRREAYLGAMAVSSPTTASSPVTAMTARKVLFRTQISEPWKALVDSAMAFSDMKNAPTPDFTDKERPAEALDERLKQLQEQIQTISWLIFADFRRFLMDYNQTVWDQVAAKTPGTLTGAKRVLYDALHAVKLDANLAKSLVKNMKTGSPRQTVETLADALRQMKPSVVTTMESSYENFVIGRKNPDFPEFLFPLVDPENLSSSPQPVITTAVTLDNDSNDDFDVNGIAATSANAAGAAFKTKIDKLAALVLRALDDNPAAGEPSVPIAAMQPADMREGWFAIRCVYERPLCPVHTEPDIVSQPTEPFQMAGFFDPDAPARPIRIGLPLDTTPSGLRKFSKNTAFVISDVLCGQIKRMKGITFGDMVLSVLPWPFHKDLPGGSGGPCTRGGLNIGTICSLSIPIITLCAFLLLMVIVILFDFIFKWLPFLIVCFPIPGLRAKPKSS
jgi:hypothetical protein